jgi:stress response protein SCP2
MVRLCPHWASSDFAPTMVLEVLPKLMNTMVVLLCDKGLEASDRAVDGYFLAWRLLAASIDAYDLHSEIRNRLAGFMKDEEQRNKTSVPSLGDLIPLLTVSDDKEFQWGSVAGPLLVEAFDRNALWACKGNPEFSYDDRNVTGQGADLERLKATFETTKVSKRLFMFHVNFLELVKQQSRDLFFGRPPRHVRVACKNAVKEIIDVESWEGFFAKCRQPCLEPAELTDRLKVSVCNSLRKGYHSKSTDFSRIHASGVSHILRKGESYRVSSTVSNVQLVLGSDSSHILCGACLVYEDLRCAELVHYGGRSAYGGAIRHSGDTQVNGNSKHTIDVDLSALPSSVTRLFFTLCACGCADLSGFQNPTIDMHDENGAPLCTYCLEDAGRAPTVVMAAITRNGPEWRVTAIGLPSAVRCCGNYSTVKRDIMGIKL